MILAITGHRPDKLGGYGALATSALNNFALVTVRNAKPDYMMIGMALGWDTACANAAVELRIPFTAAVPFVGQERPWPVDQKAHYHWLLEKAFDVHVCSPGGYAPEKMHARNGFMVDQAHAVLALWDGRPKGGTAACVAYARGSEKPVFNAWSEWQRFSVAGGPDGVPSAGGPAESKEK